MTLREILRVKGTQVHTIHPDASLADVVNKLVRHNIGSLVVCEDNNPRQMVGIITERDILRASANRRIPLAAVSVRDNMTTKIITGALNDSVEDVMGMMSDNRMRHLPIVEEGELIGIISMGDVVKAHHDQLSVENHYMRSYIHGDVDESSSFVFVRHSR